MLKIPLWNALVILAALLACGEQTPTPGGAMATVPASAGAATSEPRPVTPAAEPPETPLPVPTATPGSNAANTATPANFQDQEATSEPTPAPKEDSPNKVITPLMPDDAETFASEVSDCELACMAGTADIERLIRILLGAEQPTPQQHDFWNTREAKNTEETRGLDNQDAAGHPPAPHRETR